MHYPQTSKLSQSFQIRYIFTQFYPLIFPKSLISLLLGTLIITGCDTDITSTLDIPPDPGTADFSVFVTVGDSLTAGFADGALYRQGQEFSYPAILAESFAEVGGGTLNQPLMPVGATGPLSLTGIGDLGLSDRLVLTGTGTTDSLTPTTYTPSQSTSIDARVGNGGFKNMGVPGAKFYHAAIPGYGALSAAAIGGGTSNPYFARFSSSDAADMLTDAAGQLPTFFILWLGNNDVLSYATSGGTGVDQTGNSDVLTYGSNDITDPGFFSGGGSGAATGLPNYANVVAALKGASGKGVLVNVPDVATIPFFTTVPYNAIPLDAATAAGLQATLGDGYNAVLAGAEMAMVIGTDEANRRQLAFVEGQNPVLIVDETLTDLTAFLPPALAGLEQARPATAEDFILLTASSKIGIDFGGTYGIAVPLVDADVLTGVDAVGFALSEASTVDAARMSYNTTIKGVADADADLLLFDADAKLRELNDDGILYGTGGVTSTFATGGAFSLDGVHPTARGQHLKS